MSYDELFENIIKEFSEENEINDRKLANGKNTIYEARANKAQLSRCLDVVFNQFEKVLDKNEMSKIYKDSWFK